MISRQTIQTLAIKYQTTELNVAREYFQHLFLSGFYRQKEANKVYFKGGTALRIIYRSPRFSEDLDFSSGIRSISILENLVMETLLEIEKEGARGEIIESKKTSGGYLAIIHFEFENRPVPIQLEISMRKEKAKGELATIAGDFAPPYTLVQLRSDQLVEEKIQALLARQKPRDFYDLYFMLRANLIAAKKKNFLAQAMAALKASKISFNKELKIFLPKNQWPVIKNFSSVLEREIGRYL